MDDYEYYGLFLTQESKDKLAKWLFFNGYSPESELMKKRTGWYLDHCTLLHKSQRTSHFLTRYCTLIKQYIKGQSIPVECTLKEQ